MNITPSPHSIAFAHKLARGHADIGLSTFNQLQNISHESKNEGKPLDFLTCLMYGVPAATSLALSIELLLKVHCLQHFGSHPKRHELVSICKSLPQSSRDEMSACYSEVYAVPHPLEIVNLNFSKVTDKEAPLNVAPTFDTFESALQYADTAYIKWRYLYEHFDSEVADVNFKALLCLVECIENSIINHKGNTSIRIGDKA